MIGEILKEARIKKGLSVIDISKLIEVDRTTYFRYENNQIKNIQLTAKLSIVML